MKRIGILTYHRATNYGAVLQSYGLINRLKKDFPDCSFEIIDYSTFNAFLDHRKEEISGLFSYGIKYFFDVRKKNKMFSRFSDSLPISKHKIVSNKTKRIFKIMNKKYDAVIVGSDAVFSWNGKRFPTAYYLDANSNYLKISYAASAHRLFYKDSSAEQINYCKKALNTFKYIGVRDAETEKLVEFFDNKLITKHNCDPSFLIEQNEIYKNGDADNLIEKYNLPTDKNIIVIMTNNNDVGLEIKRSFPDYFIISLFVKNNHSDMHLAYLKPFEWASIFRFAKITITEYFHATIFSLKCGTPVVAIDTLKSSDGYEGKIHDLLVNRLKLDSMYLNIDNLKKNGMSVISKLLESIIKQKDLNLTIKNAIDKELDTYSSFIRDVSPLFNDHE